MGKLRFLFLMLFAGGFLLPVAWHAAPAASAEPAFVDGTEDVPLMAGLTEQGDGALVFDTAAGRIVQVTATGPVSAAAVRAFYKETLPQLGWAPAGADVWRRDNEDLRIEFPATGTVRFILAPATP